MGRWLLLARNPELMPALVASLMLGCLAASAACAQDSVLAVSVGKQQRTAHLHVPANIDRAKKIPLVIGYHGGAANAQQYIEQSQLFAKGEHAGFIVVCPEGTSIGPLGKHRIWNSGVEYARSSRDADDVAFTRLLIDRISSTYPIDPKRIYATGFSNGAQMVYRIAAEMADRIAAIAPMSGGRLAEGARPSRAVPVLHFHGMADGAYPLKGGLGPISLGTTPHVSIDDVILEWTRFNGARSEARIMLNDGWAMQVHDGSAPVALVLVAGMGHQIAGGNDDRLPNQAMASKPDAVEIALDFFKEHPMPDK